MPAWHGTEQQATELREAVEHNCDCARDGQGNLTRRCALHAAAYTDPDQRFLDGLLFARSMAARLSAEEWRETPKTANNPP